MGFAGPACYSTNYWKRLPQGFQSSEFLLENGFLDYIVERKDLKKTLSLQLKLFKN